ncbi:MAG: outer membrane lipoprotein-sorting protein [Desulfomonilaceae bacterium]
MTAREILDQVGKQNFNENFRMSLIIKTSKGNKLISNHVLWLTAKVREGKSSFFVDFEEPRESKGLRFLFLQEPGKEPSAFMYLPATGKTVPLAVDDPSVDVGGTGLTTEDLQGFIHQTSSQEELLREDKLDGRDSYVIRIPIPENKGERLLWISKDGFLVLQNQQLNAQGKVVRTFKVTQFFKTDEGKDFPRQEEVTVPSKGIRINVKQEFAVFGIEVPEEVMDPEKFGTYQWKG